jgi:type I restriction enzyme M protein
VRSDQGDRGRDAPAPVQTVCDPACGTGGFLLATHDYIAQQYPLDHELWDTLNHRVLRAGRS